MLRWLLPLCLLVAPASAQTKCCKIVGAHYANIATRIEIPSAGQDTNNFQSMSRRGHYARDAVSSLQVLCGNFPGIYAGGSQSVASVCKISIEYPAGTCTLAKWGGSNTVSVPYNVTKISDAVAITIPKGAQFWTRTYYTNTAGLYEFANHNDATNMGDASNIAASGVADQTTTCDTITNNSTVMVAPLGVISLTSVPSISFLGDSLVFGAFDVYNNSSGDLGVLERSIGPSYGYMNFSVDGLSAQSAGSGLTTGLTSLFNTYSSSFIDELGINDVYGNGRTLVQLEGDLNTLFAQFTIKNFQTTMTPDTTSTDNWATTVNQTVVAGNSVRVSFNDVLRAGTYSPSGGFLEAANGWETAQDSGFWKNPVAGGSSCTVSGGLYCTHDGVHGTPNGYALMQSAGTIDTTKLK